MSERAAKYRSSATGRSPAARPTDDELLDAACAVFAERGFQQATMDAIAERANSTKPTLYAHFGDKAALYRATFAREADALRRWVMSAYEAVAEQPVEGQVRGYVMALFNYADAHPDSFRLLFDGTAVDEMAPVRRDLVDVITGRVAEQIRRQLRNLGLRPGPSTELLAAMMVGLVGGAARHIQRAGQPGPIEAGELATAFIMAAVNNVDPTLLDTS